jgi:hypothetical protein
MGWVEKLFELGYTIYAWATAKTEEEKARLRAEADKKYNDMYDFVKLRMRNEAASNDKAADKILDDRFPAGA